MDGGAWWAAVHGVVKSQTRLSNFTFTFHFHALEKGMATRSSTLALKIYSALTIPTLLIPQILEIIDHFTFLQNFNFLECLILRIMHVAFQIALIHLAMCS